MAEFTTILTNTGLSEFANAIESGSLVSFSQIAVGDSNGSYYTPTKEATQLKNERWRGAVTSIHASGVNKIEISTMIPANVPGGYYIREIGIYNEKNKLLAIGKVPESFKPDLSSGSTKDLNLKIVFEVSNTDVINMSIDPNVTIASNRYVQEQIEPITQQLAQIKTYVTYEDFGAIGDGVTDDWQALKDTHDYANLNSVPVKVTRSDAIYYVKDAPSEIEVYTDVDWVPAKFLIDDSTLTEDQAKRDIFVIKDENVVVNITTSITSLNKSQMTISILEGLGDVILKVENSNVLRWKRKGLNADNGVIQQESIHVKDGKVLTDILWDYPSVTNAIYKRVSDVKRKIIGGTFETLRNTLSNSWDYGVKRGIRVERSNTLIAVSHKMIEHNGVQSKPYYGFISTEFAYDVTISDATVTGQKTFYASNSAPLGTYELAFSHTIKLTVDRVRQTNDITDETLWGVFTSNFCKDIVVKDSILSRIDVHKSLHNLRAIDSIIGHQALQLNGSGLCEIERCKFYSGSFIFLRQDYGSTWDGVVRIKDSYLYPPSSELEPHFIYFNNQSDHDFGYKCYHPDLEIDNVIIDTQNADSVSFIYAKYLDSERINYRSELDYDAEVALGRYPYIFKNYLRARNVKLTVKRPMSIFYNPMSAIYCENKNAFSLNSDYTNIYSPNPLTVLSENFFIEIDNCDLDDRAGNTVSSGALIAYQAVNTTKGDFNFNNHRMIPKIILKNMNLAINGGLFPFLLTTEDCNIYKLTVGGSGYKFGHIFFKGCTFGHPTDTSSFAYNAKNLWFENTKFILSKNGATTVTLTELSSLYMFFSRIQTISNNRLKTSLRMTNCEFSNPINFDEISDSIYGVNLNSELRKVVNFDTFIRKYGGASLRPYTDVKNGDVYYNTDTNVQQTFIDGNWR